MLNVGLDVHWRTSTYCILDSNGKKIKTRTVRGGWRLLLAELTTLPRPWSVCYEASCGYGVLVAVGLLALPAASLAQHEGHHPEGDTAAADESATKPAKCEMCKMMMQRMKTMAKLKAVLNEAKGAAEAEKATKAVEKIDEALALIEQQHKGMHAMMAQHMQKTHKDMMMGKGMMGKGNMGNGMMAEEMKCPMCGKMMAQANEGKVVNARCPIMGNKLDRDNVPENLTREWNGKKVGFCCAACPRSRAQSRAA